MDASDVEHEEKQDPVLEKECLAAEKKKRDQQKARLKKERQAVNRERKSKEDAIAAEVAAKAAAVEAAEQAIVDAKAAAVAEIEAQRLAKIAAKKKQREKTTDGLDDFAFLESTIAANERSSDKEATAAQAANMAPMAAERSALLLEAFERKKKQLAKGVKQGKKTEAAGPSAEQKAYEARLATAAEVTRQRNMEKEREAAAQRAEAKSAAARGKQIESNKPKPQAVTASPVDRTVRTPAPVRDASKELCSLKLEIESLEASVAVMAQAVVLDRVTELMIQLDDVPVSSTAQRECRKSAIGRLDAISAGAK